jgi:hypothetical protein
MISVECKFMGQTLKGAGGVLSSKEGGFSDDLVLFLLLDEIPS